MHKSLVCVLYFKKEKPGISLVAFLLTKVALSLAMWVFFFFYFNQKFPKSAHAVFVSEMKVTIPVKYYA